MVGISAPGPARHSDGRLEVSLRDVGEGVPKFTHYLLIDEYIFELSIPKLTGRGAVGLHGPCRLRVPCGARSAEGGNGYG